MILAVVRGNKWLQDVSFPWWNQNELHQIQFMIKFMSASFNLLIHTNFFFLLVNWREKVRRGIYGKCPGIKFELTLWCIHDVFATWKRTWRKRIPGSVNLLENTESWSLLLHTELSALIWEILPYSILWLFHQRALVFLSFFVVLNLAMYVCTLNKFPTQLI